MHDSIIQALRRGAVDDALAEARNAVADRPEDAQAHRWLAVSQAQAGQPDAALASIDHAIGLAPDDAELHLVRASLLLATAQPDAAQTALMQATGLDPNQFAAYLLQAQLALVRGDVDEAERLARLAARIEPDHPQVAAVEGMVALRRGDTALAVEHLNEASKSGPDSPQLFYGLGFAYLQQGHLAFAEQAFARALELSPEAQGLRGLLAKLMLQQHRPDEALAILQPLLEQPAPSVGLQRLVGALELGAGRPERALPWLRAAFAAQPQDARVLPALVETWRLLGQSEAGRAELDAALAEHPQSADLWEARLAATPPEQAGPVIERWLAAMPDHPAALEALATEQDRRGDQEATIATTRRVVALDPTRLVSALRLASLELGSDPAAAIARLRALLPQHPGAEAQRLLRNRLAIAYDHVGQVDDAVAAWTALRAESLPRQKPLPTLSAPRGDWPPMAEVHPHAPARAFLWGPPGSGVELLAQQAERAGLPILGDRFGPDRPGDLLQRPDVPAQLVAGTLSAEEVIGQWRQALPQRGHQGGPLIDWLRWWDNALLLALRPQLPHALLVVALRDPRDMLLDWLAVGAPSGLGFQSAELAAGWLAAVLDQIATLHEQDLFPHHLVRLDDAIASPAAQVQLLNAALGTELEPTPQLPPALRRLPAGRWRTYAGPLGPAFAALTAVAGRLGYPAD